MRKLGLAEYIVKKPLSLPHKKAYLSIRSGCGRERETGRG